MGVVGQYLEFVGPFSMVLPWHTMGKERPRTPEDDECDNSPKYAADNSKHVFYEY